MAAKPGRSAKPGRLLAIIGDEVCYSLQLYNVNKIINNLVTDSHYTLYSKDTCTGFLLGGVGEVNAKRQKNFFVVRKGMLGLAVGIYFQGLNSKHFPLIGCYSFFDYFQILH